MSARLRILVYGAVFAWIAVAVLVVIGLVRTSDQQAHQTATDTALAATQAQQKRTQDDLKRAQDELARLVGDASGQAASASGQASQAQGLIGQLFGEITELRARVATLEGRVGTENLSVIHAEIVSIDGAIAGIEAELRILDKRSVEPGPRGPAGPPGPPGPVTVCIPLLGTCSTPTPTPKAHK